MKKYAWIAISSFTLGLLLAGYVFLILPEKSAPAPDIFAKPASPAATASSTLFAAAPPQEKATLDFVTIAEKAGPAVVRIEAERRVSRSQSGGDWPFGDEFFDRIFPQPRQKQPESNTVLTRAQAASASAGASERPRSGTAASSPRPGQPGRFTQGLQAAFSPGARAHTTGRSGAGRHRSAFRSKRRGTRPGRPRLPLIRRGSAEPVPPR